MGELRDAETACNQSMQAAPFDEEMKARSMTGLANILEAEGKTREALDMRRQILETARKIGSQKDIIGALQNLADLVDAQGNAKEARETTMKRCGWRGRRRQGWVDQAAE